MARDLHRLCLEGKGPRVLLREILPVQQVQRAQGVQPHVFVFAGIVRNDCHVAGGEQIQAPVHKFHVGLVRLADLVFPQVENHEFGKRPYGSDPFFLVRALQQHVKHRVEHAERGDARHHHCLKRLFAVVVVVLKHGVYESPADSFAGLPRVHVVQCLACALYLRAQGVEHDLRSQASRRLLADVHVQAPGDVFFVSHPHVSPGIAAFRRSVVGIA